MIKFFIDVIQAGIGIVIILALLWSLAYKDNNKHIKEWLIGTIVLGLLGTTIATILLSASYKINKIQFAYKSIIPVVIILLFYLVFIRTFIYKKSPKFYSLCLVALTSLYSAFAIFFYLPKLLLIPKSFVKYGEVSVNSEILLRIIGYILGIVLLIVLYIAIMKLVETLSDNKHRILNTLALIIFGISQWNIILIRLYSLSILPKNKYIFYTLSFINNHARYLTIALMFLLFVVAIMLIIQNKFIDSDNYSNVAVRRKDIAAKRRVRRWAYSVICILIFSIINITIISNYVDKEPSLSDPEPYEVENNMAKIPIKLLNDTHLHRFEYVTENDKHIRFIVIEKNTNSYGVGYDACEVCGVSGYYERKDQVVCKLCDVVMNKGTIGFKGGCNPIPIPFKVEDGHVLISIDDLLVRESLFK